MAQATLPTVTVGIPAYNEAANIGYLLEDILRQEERGFALSEIIVMSDGSTDETAAVVRGIADPRITLVEGRERLGQAPRQNEIIARTTTDILVLLNADIALEGPCYIASLIGPILTGEVDFTSSRVIEYRSRGIVAHALAASELCKRVIIARWNSGNNYLSCSGRARSFRKSFYKRLEFLDSVGEDMYSYFWGISQGFKYAYVPNAVAYMKLPETVEDFFRQSIRFAQSKQPFTKIFGPAFMSRQSTIPPVILLSACLHAFFRRPMHMAVYAILFILARIQYFTGRRVKSLWEVSSTSKRLK